MARRVLTDEIWGQLQEILKSKGCHSWENDKDVMEAILWKLRTGAPGVMSPNHYAPGKRPIIVLIAGPKKGYGKFFL